jgi:ATP-dependent protease HslVU (ClpYQ) peptidase subunit
VEVSAVTADADFDSIAPEFRRHHWRLKRLALGRAWWQRRPWAWLGAGLLARAFFGAKDLEAVSVVLLALQGAAGELADAQQQLEQYAADLRLAGDHVTRQQLEAQAERKAKKALIHDVLKVVALHSEDPVADAMDAHAEHLAESGPFIQLPDAKAHAKAAARQAASANGPSARKGG